MTDDEEINPGILMLPESMEADDEFMEKLKSAMTEAVPMVISTPTSTTYLPHVSVARGRVKYSYPPKKSGPRWRFTKEGK